MIVSSLGARQFRAQSHFMAEHETSCPEKSGNENGYKASVSTTGVRQMIELGTDHAVTVDEYMSQTRLTNKRQARINEVHVHPDYHERC